MNNYPNRDWSKKLIKEQFTKIKNKNCKNLQHMVYTQLRSIPPIDANRAGGGGDVDGIPHVPLQ
jgi:hypothetical protein